MKYKAKNSLRSDDIWAHFHNIGVIEKQCQQTLDIRELCSIPCKDNSELSKNTISPNIIDRKSVV